MVTELILDADADTSITADTDDQIDFKTGGTDRMTIDSTGRISINETGTYNDANEFLLIKNTDGAANLSIVADNAQHSTLKRKNLGDEDDWATWVVFATSTATILRLLLDAERVRIDSAGNLLVGSLVFQKTAAQTLLRSTRTKS